MKKDWNVGKGEPNIRDIKFDKLLILAYILKIA